MQSCVFFQQSLGSIDASHLIQLALDLRYSALMRGDFCGAQKHGVKLWFICEGECV